MTYTNDHANNHMGEKMGLLMSVLNPWKNMTWEFNTLKSTCWFV